VYELDLQPIFVWTQIYFFEKVGTKFI
jgi:hypothetical protein